MKDYKKAGKLYLKLTGILYPIYGDRIEFHLGETEDTGIYMHIRKGGTGGIYEDFIPVNMDDPDIEEIIHQVKEMFEPKFVPIKQACIDLIGKTVYVDKHNLPFVVQSIDKEGIWLNENLVVSIDELWIKE